MKTIKFILMGNQNIGKSTLLDTYLWKLKYGCDFHDHTEEQTRYLIDVIKIDKLEELHEHLVENYFVQNIFFVCFKVTDRRTLRPAREIWILELLKQKPNTKIFLVGLQCDLREQLLTKLRNECLSYSEGVSISRYYENVHYMECSSNKLDSVRDIFDKAIRMVLYDKNTSSSARIIEFYEKMPIQFKFEFKNICNDD